MNNVRPANLRLLRHGVFNTDQTNFANTVNIHQSKLSELERGKVVFDDELARKIEMSFNLPIGWMDRDNSGLFLTTEEYALIKQIRELSIEQKNSLFNLLNGMARLLRSKPGK